MDQTEMTSKVGSTQLWRGNARYFYWSLLLKYITQYPVRSYHSNHKLILSISEAIERAFSANYAICMYVYLPIAQQIHCTVSFHGCKSVR